MAGEYERWLIPRGNVFAPAAASVAKLVAKLREEGWIAPGGRAMRSVENRYGRDVAARRAASTEAQPAVIDAAWLDDPAREELRLVWSGAAPLRYPLSRRPDGEVSWSLELHRAPEYVYPIADTIDPLDTTCACGEDQEFEWDPEEIVPAFGAATGIFAECEECSRTFDPATRTATIENPFDHTKEEVAGGAAYRFALKVDCGRSFVADPKLAFAPELVALVEKEFGRAFYEVGALY